MIADGRALEELHLAGSRPDQLAFAVEAWHRLYGVAPFHAEAGTVPADALLEAPPAHDLPPAVERILRRALAADHRRRYLDLTALLDALEAAALRP